MDLNVDMKMPPQGQPLPEVWNATPGDDAQLDVEFYRDPESDGHRVRIGFRSDQTTVIDEEVDASHIARFGRLWQAYNSGQDYTQGTPLSEVKWVDRESLGRLHYMRIFSVEQLAGLNDSAIEQAGPMIGLANFRIRAQKHLERTQRAMGMDQALEANAQLADQVRKMQEQMQQLIEQQQAGSRNKGEDQPVPTPVESEAELKAEAKRRFQAKTRRKVN